MLHNIERLLRRLVIALASALVFLCPFVASAQTMNDDRIESKLNSGKVIAIDGPRPSQQEIDSMKRVISIFYYDQFRHFDDPDAPYFMFMSRDADLAMGIGGSVRVKGWYEWGGALPINGLSPAFIPIPENPARTRHLGANVSGSELFFRILGKNRHIGNYQVYIQAGFSGYNGEDFKIKKAYGTIRDFTVGLATSTFSDPMAMAPDFDASGLNTKFDETRVLVRYMPTFKDRYTLALSVEYPKQASIQVEPNKVQATATWMPDFAMFLQYRWSRTSHVRFAALTRTLGYRDLVSLTNHNVQGWGVQLSSSVEVNRALTLFGTASYGRGMTGITNDLLAGNYDLVGDSEANPGVLYAPRSIGWSVGAQCFLLPNLFLSASASQVRYLPKHRTDPEDYKYGMYAFGGLVYNLTPRITFAGQFTWGLRHNQDGAHKAARRVEAVAMFSF